MSKIGDKKNFTRRAVVLGGMQLSVCFVLVGRIYYLQISERNKYNNISKKNYVHSKILLPHRGRVFDRNGKLIISNNESTSVFLTSRSSPEKIISTLEKLDTLIHLTEKEKQRITKAMRKNRRFVNLAIRKNIKWENIAQIAANNHKLPGIELLVTPYRYYHFGKSMAPITGYVQKVKLYKNDESNKSLFDTYSSTYKGIQGIERSFNEELKGNAGVVYSKVDVRGQEIETLDTSQQINGQDLNLSVDTSLQSYIYDVMAEKIGSTCVMEIETGEVLAMVSSPSYDPNIFQFNEGNELSNYFHDTKHSLNNRAIRGLYPPASTFKTIISLAGLHYGVIDPHRKVLCDGSLQVGNHKFHCWMRWGHGKLNMENALKHSCDVFFYQLALDLGIERIYQMATHFGLGEETKIELYNEYKGLMPNKEWKQHKFKKSWFLGDTVMTAIGQGYVLTTPIQLVNMIATIARDGKKIQPTLLKNKNKSQIITELHTPENEIPEQGIVIAKEHFDVVRHGIYKVVNEVGGSAHNHAIDIADFRMAGKTGTAQVRNISMEERQTGVIKNRHLNFKQRDHSLFVGYAPANNPKYAISVVLEHGGGGEISAAETARNVLLYMHNNYKYK